MRLLSLQWLSFATVLLYETSACAQQLKPIEATHPLSAVFQNRPAFTVEEVKELARIQAATQPKYKSGKIESLLFEGCFVPSAASTTLVLFSDDGVDLEIDGKKVLPNFGKGQHLPNLAQSFLEVKGSDGRGTSWVPGRMYEVKIKYSNIIFTGDADIDGCTMFACQGGGAVPEVRFENTTRGGDVVVAAKDEGKGMPGGIKELTIKLVNADAAELKIVQNKDSTGTAFFDKDLKKDDLKNVKDGTAITIFGNLVSKKARDIYVEASVKGKACGKFEFTVFRVDLSFSPEKGVGATVPGEARNFVGISLREVLRRVKSNTTTGFHFDKAPPYFVGGTVLVSGKIVPTGMMRSDFFRKGDKDYLPGRGFKIFQEIAQRNYVDNCFATDNSDFAEDKSQLLMQDQDQLDSDEPAKGDLRIYLIDDPRTGYTHLALAKNEVHRRRVNFNDVAKYAGIQCSAKLEWHLATSVKRTEVSPFGRLGRPTDYALDTTFDKKGDNTVDLGHLPLTSNLEGKADLPPFEIKAFRSPQATGRDESFTSKARAEFSFSILGNRFPVEQGKDARSLKISFIEISGKGQKATVKTYSSDKVKIDGEAAFDNEKDAGIYRIQIVKGDVCVTNEFYGIPRTFTQPVFSRLGSPAMWAFSNDLDGRGRGSVYEADSLGSNLDLRNVPQVARSGGVQFKVDDVKFDPGILAYGFTAIVTDPKAKAPFVFMLKATGDGVTGERTYELPSRPIPP